ncbi:hypothetical protein [Acinetobacter venetianus]|uniref:hypothetical protein n=1 Tax=Acinetobacter venetianus TaxID=52133 RepID=UPI00241FA4B2|nr:hypothetical protein [Acinetobacter venetianus]
MSEGQYELVVNPDYVDFNLELLQDYWQFSDIEKHQFTYTSKELLQKYDIRSSAKLERIAKHSGHLKYTGLKNCEKCYFDYEIFIRKDINFKRWNQYKEKLVCHECRRVYVQNYMNKYLNEFKLFIPTVSDSQYDSPTQQLSYLERIVLYVMLTKIEIGTNNILPQNEWHSFIELEGNGAGDVIKKLFEKGYLFKTNEFDEFIQKQKELHQLHLECKQYLNEDTKDEIHTLLAMNYRANIYLIIPSSYGSLEQWILGLFKEIEESKINAKDFKEVEKYIKNKRLNEVYALLDFVCQYKKIPIKKNNALELDLMRMLIKYDLQHIFSLFWYQSKFASDRLRTLELSNDTKDKYIKEYVFGKKISSYLDYLDRVNEKPKYPKRLPENWTYSEIELFACTHVIGNYERWEKFTPDQILSFFVKANGSDDAEMNMN